MAKIEKDKLQEILLNLMGTAKRLALYSDNHPSVRGPLHDTYQKLASLLRLHSRLTLAIVDEVLVFEGVPFYSSHPAIKELQEKMESFKVNALDLKEGLSEPELLSFLKILNEDSKLLETAGSFSALLSKQGIVHISVKDVKEVYNKALSAVSEVLEDARLGRIPKAGSAKAAVGELQEAVLKDRPALLALTLIKSYDNYLFNHSVNVSILALALAHELKIPEKDIPDIGLAGLLHDIGKTMTPKEITLKPGTLTPEEWEIMRTHPIKSEEIVLKMKDVSALVARLVKEHHVNYDLKGYPELEPGQHPHPYSKIITVADVYDAVTTLRPYQKPFHPREAMRIMENLSGKVIDPKYFEAFVRVLGIYPVGTLVRLDTNEIGVVVETYAETPLTPRVRVIFSPEGNLLPRPLELDLSKPESYEGEPRFIVAPVDPLLYNVDPTNYL